MNTYVAIYRGKRCEVQSDTRYHAQLEAARILRAKRSYDVSIMLAEKDGKTVVHDGAELA